MDYQAMGVRKVLVQIQMTNAKQMEPALFVRDHLISHIPAALIWIQFAMEEQNASVTLVLPRRAIQLPVQYVTVLAIALHIQAELASAD